MQSSSGFREHAHTADWELEVWAPDLPGLLEQAARGMYALSGVRGHDSPRREISLSLHAADAESLLVQFLTELLWHQSRDRLVFDGFSISIDESLHLDARLNGSPLAGLDKEIKAVTYHNLHIQDVPQGLQVSIVFDV